MDQLDIDNKASEGHHENHFHLYLKPPAPEPMGSINLFAQADTGVMTSTAVDVVEISPMLLAAAQGVASVKYDKIVNECNFARTYATDTDEPAMVAKGQYAHSYEQNQKLKVIKVEVIRKPKYGDLVSLTSEARDGKLFPSDTHFEMRATSLDYLGRDLAEYAVELSNGKRVLVRTHIYWVNSEVEIFGQCPPTKEDIRQIALDPSGNVVVSGTFTTTITFGGITLNTGVTWPDEAGMFVARISPGGVWQSATSLGDGTKFKICDVATIYNIIFKFYDLFFSFF